MRADEYIEKKVDVGLLDVRKITRNYKDVGTIVIVFESKYDRHGTRWIHAGESSLRRSHEGQRWSLNSYLESATDFEHDSAYAFQLPLIGLRFNHLDYGVTHLEGWVDPDADDNFRVPMPGYNPVKKAERCTRCRGKEAHVIVPQGFYVPKFDPELYRKVSGKRVEIAIGPAINLNFKG